jgi:type I restriction enzyme S subunit
METMTQKIDLNNLDKSTWEPFKFEEIAQKISETVNPNKTDLEIYIGLEHIDAEDIHIRRKGTPDDVKGGKLRCYPGDVIFGKRRAYQRKAAIVDFDGICSAHAFVFRANEETIDSKLFPFFLHSNQFMHRMIDISVGGLSPTINWGDLKHEEFLLPPKDQQAKLAELLWAMDELIESEINIKDLLELNYSSSIKSIFNRQKELIKIKNIDFDSFKGLSAEENENGIFDLIPSGGVFPRYLKSEKLKRVNIYSEKNLSKSLMKNDILFNTGGVGTLGRSHYFTIENNKFFCDSFVLVLRFNDDNYLNKYIYHVFQSNNILSQIIQHTKGTTGITSISIDGIKNFKIPNLNIEEQKNISNKLDKIEISIFAIESKVLISKALKNSLINQVF